MEINKEAFVGAVTALQFSADETLLYAAVGCTLYIYEVARGIQCSAPIVVWRQGTIHGMDGGANGSTPLVLCYGQKHVALLHGVVDSIATAFDQKQPTILALECMDWVLDARLLLDDHEAASEGMQGQRRLPRVAVGLAHNMIHIWDPETHSIVQRFQCTERSILYAMGLFGRSLDTLVVAAGTVFQHILLWAPPHQPSTEESTAPIAPSQRLHQHDGVIFRLVWASHGRELASVSDDRSVQLWSNRQDKNVSMTAQVLDRQAMLDTSFQSVFRGWSHTARVWDVQFTSHGQLVSASEDATCKLWSAQGDCLATLHGHLDTNVWRVAVHPRNLRVVATGGGDGAIKIWDLDEQQRNQSIDSVLTLPTIQENDDNGTSGGSNGAKTTATLRNLVTLSSRVYWITDQSHVGFHDLASNSSTNSVLTRLDGNLSCLAATMDLIAVGDVRGNLTLLSPSNSQTALVSVASVQAAHAGRIMAIWIVEETQAQDDNLSKPVSIFTTGMDFTLYEWRYHSNIDDAAAAGALQLVGKYSCPNKTSCLTALVVTPSMLWGGDARGNVCGYVRQNAQEIDAASSGQPPRAVRYQVHGKDVVSSLAWRPEEPSRLYSCGHDGFICTLEINPLDDRQLECIRRVSVKGISTLRSIQWTDGGDFLVFGFHASNAIVVNVTQSVRLLTLDCGGWRRPHALWINPDDANRQPQQQHVFGFALPKSSNVHVHQSTRRIAALSSSLSWHSQHHSKMGCCVDWIAHDLIVTGGEDGAVKLHQVDKSQLGIHCIDSVSMHITNVRAIGVVNDFVVTGGGKQSLHLWRLNANQLAHVAEYTPSDAPQDQRILALAVHAVTRDQVIVVATNSEGQVSLFTASSVVGFILRKTWTDSDKPILSCALSHGFFVTGVTDGHVVVWDIEPLLRSNMDNLDAIPMTPVYKYRAHDMGANCLCARSLDHKSPSSLQLLSGGDDQCIAHIELDVTAGRSQLQVRHLPGVRNASASALKTIKCMDDVVVAAGYDQRVTAWCVQPDDTLARQGAVFAETADIAGLSLRQSVDGEIHGVVIGKGMQTLRLRHRK
ncbi:unnamed protein product [Aphanomyces euteiches]